MHLVQNTASVYTHTGSLTHDQATQTGQNSLKTHPSVLPNCRAKEPGLPPSDLKCTENQWYLSCFSKQTELKRKSGDLLVEISGSKTHISTPKHPKLSRTNNLKFNTFQTRKHGYREGIFCKPYSSLGDSNRHLEPKWPLFNRFDQKTPWERRGQKESKIRDPHAPIREYADFRSDAREMHRGASVLSPERPFKYHRWCSRWNT